MKTALFQRSGDPEDSAAGKSDDGIMDPNTAQSFQRRDSTQRREPFVAHDLIIRAGELYQLADQFFRFRCQADMNVFGVNAAECVQPAGAAVGVGDHLCLVDHGNFIARAEVCHFDGGCGDGGSCNRDAFFTGEQ